MAPTKRAVRRRPVREEEPEEVVQDDHDEDESEEDEDGPIEQPEGTQIRSGWTGSEQNFDANSKFAQTFKLTDKAQAIKFLEDRPYAGYSRHWVERTYVDDKGKAKKVNRPYTCLKSVGFDSCPLCQVGDKPQSVSCFNIAVLGDDGVPTLKSWDCGIRLYKIIKSYNSDPKVGPINKGYYLVSRTGSMQGGSINYQVNPVTGRSLLEDYNTPVPDADLLEELPRYDRSIIQVPKRKDLREVAAEMADYDDEHDDD